MQIARRKIHLFHKCHSFRSTTKNDEVIAEKTFHKSGVTRRLWTLGRLELTLVVNTMSCFSLKYYSDTLRAKSVAGTRVQTYRNLQPKYMKRGRE